jgi:dynein heavy chain
MNSIKMIHTIARYYNTNERMTGLFVKITNMMIHNCKYNIINFRKIRLGLKPEGMMGGGGSGGRKAAPLDDLVLWKEEEYPHDELIAMLETCEDLLAAYKHNYEKTRDRLKEMPKAKQFDFSEQAIFNKFELFCRRVGKLKELFKTIKQFKVLEKHNLEGIEPIVESFDRTVKEFQKKNHKLLDYLNGLFDKDYVEFNLEVSHVEKDLQRYINQNFDHISNIEDSLKLLKKFCCILDRPLLQKNLSDKYELLLKNYSRILDKIEQSYNNNNKNPPIVRNLPTISGNITWSRHLIHRAMVPLKHFPKDKLMPNGKAIKQYTTASKISITLYAYELAWR